MLSRCCSLFCFSSLFFVFGKMWGGLEFCYDFLTYSFFFCFNYRLNYSNGPSIISFLHFGPLLFFLMIWFLYFLIFHIFVPSFSNILVPLFFYFLHFIFILLKFSFKLISNFGLNLLKLKTEGPNYKKKKQGD